MDYKTIIIKSFLWKVLVWLRMGNTCANHKTHAMKVSVVIAIKLIIEALYRRNCNTQEIAQATQYVLLPNSQQEQHIYF